MAATPPSHVYYFEVGAGTWRGTFTFRVTSWRTARRASIGLKNLLLVFAMQATQRVAGPSRLLSVVAAHPDEGEFGVADNRVVFVDHTGDVITQVGRKNVKSVAEFETEIKNASLDKGVLLLVRSTEGSRFVVLKSE